MSVELQAPSDHNQFGIDSAKFEEIVANTNERLPRSNRTSRTFMEKESDSDRFYRRENGKETNRSPLRPNYSSDEQSSYEDDFEESEKSSPRKAPHKQSSTKLNSRASSYSSRSPENSAARSPSIVSPRSNKKAKVTKRYKAYRSPRTTSPAASRMPERSWAKPKNRSANVNKVSRLDQTVVDRVLSANRHKVQKLESRLSQLVKELTIKTEENKTLKQIHYRQEKELMKINNEEAELPRLLTKHSSEVKSLRERLRRLQESAVQKEIRISEQDKEILKLKDRCKHYKDLCEMKNLNERADLQKKLHQTHATLEKRDSEISKLQRMLNLKEKTHSRHLREQKDKVRETQARLQEMEENCKNLQDRLKEKEKQLDYTNIYQRQIVLRDKNQTSPDNPPKLAALPAPKKNKTKSSNRNDSNRGENIDNNGNKEKAVQKEVEMNKKPDSVFLTAHSDTGSDKELDKNGQIAKKDGQQLSITDGSDVLDMTGSMNRGKPLVEDELVKEEERRKKEEFEKHLWEEDDRLKKEKEEQERRRKEEKKREKRKQTEREAKWQEDLEKREREEEDRKKELARQLSENERKKEEESKGKELKEKENSFLVDEEARRKKDLLLARLKAIDNEKASEEDGHHSDTKRLSSGKSGDESVKSHHAKKNMFGSTRQVDENLHNGLPAIPKENSVTSPPVSVKSDPDSIVGIPRHKPVLLGRGNLTKKSTNFSWLEDKKPTGKTERGKPDDDFSFGDYSPTISGTKNKNGDQGKNLDGDFFNTGISRRPARGRHREGLGNSERRDGGYGNDVFEFTGQKGGDGFNKTRNQNNLPFLSDDFGSRTKSGSPTGALSANEPLLPRRRRAQERNTPVISSIYDDNLDNDIEELAL